MSSMDYRELFAKVKTFAIVGYSDNPARAGHYVPDYLARQGYRILAINPKFSGSVDGFPAFHSLAEIPVDEKVDVIDIFRAPEHLPDVLRDALAMANRPAVFWMQPGAENEVVAQQAAAAGMQVVMHACALAEHRKLEAAPG